MEDSPIVEGGSKEYLVKDIEQKVPRYDLGDAEAPAKEAIREAEGELLPVDEWIS